MLEAPLFPSPSPWTDPARRKALALKASLAELVSGFRLYLLLEGRSPGTADLYAKMLEEFGLFLEAQGRTLLAPFRGDAVAFAHDLAQRGRSPSYIAHLVSALRRFGEFLSWCGLEPPQLEMPPRKSLERRLSPASEEVFALLLREIPHYPNRGAPLLGAVYVLLGGLGLRLDDALRLTVEDVDLPRLRLPGGWVRVFPPYLPYLEAYLDARRLWNRLPGFRPLLVLPSGMPPARKTSALYSNYHKRYLAWLGLTDVPFRSLTLLGGRRMVEAYGLREAQRLLKRYVVV